MNFIKKIFSNKKKINLKKKLKIIWKIFLGFFLVIFIFLSIFIYSFLWDFKNFFWNIPSMTWFFWEKKYLILMLNNSEIRPWWWFISSFAEIDFFLWVPKITVKNSYDIWAPNPMITPPFPYDKLFWEDQKVYKWRVFRDANLSPDYPNSVAKIVELYEKWRWKVSNLDWVFSIDMEFLWSLLKISWAVKVDWKIFNEKNYFYQTQILSKDLDLHSIKNLNSRKNFLKPLIAEISSKIFHNSLKNFNTINKFFDEIKKLSDQKHIQLFFSDKNLEEKVKKLEWDWKFSPKWEDFIHINISNIWWRKADRYIRKNYFYDIDFTWKNPIWELKILVKHLWTKSLISDFYQAFYQIYLPKWVEILNFNEIKNNIKNQNNLLKNNLFTNWFNQKYWIKISEKLDSFVIWGLVQMNPWEEKEIIIKYKLPKIVNSKNYNLNLITQAWENWENWDISAREKTDNIWSIQNINKNIKITENVATFEWKIFQNTLLSLKDLWDKTQPIIVSQKFIENNLIKINFSEKISTDFLKNDENNKKNILIKNIKTNKNIKISKKYLKWNNLFLKLENFEYKKWEFYEVILKNIHDLSWNYTSRRPLIITIVQK